ncbi:MAG TPA: TIGR00282 family metallophosphoesterase [Candidatus Brocadiia bacterium]|nr:TIGR00282 family metallophosphoesterase [Planctomycetota bacterium]MBI4007299.1 TIGR00282 family metallophosphoesterase [Planctomycetota bacterium]MDO8092858.1 TIGR00282 family metallophosphoesterase [Candidatus Brocadiales bacterium]
MKLKILAIGDIVGRPGRQILQDKLPTFIKDEKIDFCIANGENSAGGSGITGEVASSLLSFGVDVITMGDHVWKKKEVVPLLENERRLLRPENYSPLARGRGIVAINSKCGEPIGVINLLGRVFMKPIDCPFRVVDQVLKEFSGKTRVIIVDLHAEATSEKIAMGWYLNGRVSAVVGTHTHVQTADERILPNGTAYITDLGMTGSHESILGRSISPVLKAIVTQMPERFDVAERDVRICGVVISVDSSTGKAQDIKRIVVRENE